jgi:two-component system heavy metal sensor histidine kinase CusS
MRWLSPEQVTWTSLRVHLTLWNTLVSLLIVGSCVAAARLAVRSALYHEADSTLRAECTEVVLASEDPRDDTQSVVDVLRRKAASHEHRGWFSHLLSEDGMTIWRSSRCPDVVASFPPQRKDRLENIVQLPGYRYVRHRIDLGSSPPLHVRIGTSTAGLDAAVQSLTRSLTAVGLGMAILTPLIGYWMAVRATRPVAEILRTADSLRPTRLGDRLPIRGARDELDQLSVTINRLLDQVADHVDRQRQFLADAAHELRGPLAAIRSSLEVAVSRERTAGAYRNTIDDVLEETAHLAKLANDLLLLAESDGEPTGEPAAGVELTRIARQTVDMFTGVAEERGIDVQVVTAQPVLARVDAGQFRQVIGNLLDNAIRFTPAGGNVRIALAQAANGSPVVLQVRDTGVGIPTADVPRVFDRFFKADQARTRGERGGGLGLPICRAIVARHGGTISLASEQGRGTVVTVHLPAADGGLLTLAEPSQPAHFAGIAS